MTEDQQKDAVRREEQGQRVRTMEEKRRREGEVRTVSLGEGSPSPKRTDQGESSKEVGG